MRTIFLWTGAILLTVFWGSISLFASFFDKKGNLGFRCMQKWSRGILKLAGIEFGTEGFEKIERDRNYLFVSNHQSQVDVIALSAVIPVKFGWMAKKELFKIPFMGWHMKRMGYVAIDRSSIKSSTEGLIHAAKCLREGGSLVIFPEGSRSKDGKLKPFKDGAFFLAVESKVGIVPLTINGTADIIRKGSTKVNTGRVRIIASDIINVENYTHNDREKLKELVRGSISSKLESN